MKALVGYTGFVGSNIYDSGEIDAAYNSKNIGEAWGTKPDLLVFAGLRAEKYLANLAPEKDLNLIREAESSIERIAPRKLVLISTIDVFHTPIGVDEASPVETEGLGAYGYNRYLLEQWVRERYPDALIIRLPGLFGRNIKKNFIYDMIHRIPFMLKKEKMEELLAAEPSLLSYYELQDNGFYRVRPCNGEETALLRETFGRTGFSALSFTDSRSRFQFYNLKRLWPDIRTALREGITLWHPATEPVTAAEVYHCVTGEDFENYLTGRPADYDYRTVHDSLFGGSGGYICGKERVLEEIKEFAG